MKTKTMNATKLLIFISFGFFSLQSCSQSKKKNETAVKIFEDLKLVKPIWCLDTTINNKECILCIANKTGAEATVDDKTGDVSFDNQVAVVFYKLTKFANSWRVEVEKPVFTDDSFEYCNFYDGFEVKVIKGKPYLYFLYDIRVMGNAVTSETISFALFSLSDYKLTTLDYEVNDDDKGDFINLDSFKNKLTLRTFLEGKASKSRFIYRATKEDLDMNNVINYRKKWTVDNPGLKNFYYDGKVSLGALHLSFYSDSLFKKDETTIENSSYRIKANPDAIHAFGGDILGFDKTKRKYFPIFIQYCNYCPATPVKFLSESTIELDSPDFRYKLIFDLSKMTYTIKAK